MVSAWLSHIVSQVVRNSVHVLSARHVSSCLILMFLAYCGGTTCCQHGLSRITERLCGVSTAWCRHGFTELFCLKKKGNFCFNCSCSFRLSLRRQGRSSPVNKKRKTFKKGSSNQALVNLCVLQCYHREPIDKVRINKVLDFSRVFDNIRSSV